MNLGKEYTGIFRVYPTVPLHVKQHSRYMNVLLDRRVRRIFLYTHIFLEITRPCYTSASNYQNEPKMMKKS